MKDNKHYQVIVYKNKNSNSIVKLYNATDAKDAKEIYHHWILEADNGENIVLVASGRRAEEHVKSGNSKMEVLKL
jgi:phosphotransferase system HPr-like phosphotransfer protein